MSGGSGLIGSSLHRTLTSRGTDVVRLVRSAPTAPDEVYWNPAGGELNPDDVEGFDAVVNLAGAGIGDKRWSDERRRLISASRTGSTRLLAEALAGANSKPDVFISGSAIGIYGGRVEPVTEDDGPADPPDFLSDVAVAWEAATGAAESAGIRTVHIRTGIVLAEGGGALARLLLPFKLGLGGKLGSGDAWWSWISIDDEVGAIEHLIDSSVVGPVNLTSPVPATSGEVTKVLGRVLGRPTVLPVPRVGLEALLGKDLAAALLFTSAQVIPAKLEGSGYEFKHRDLESALRAVLNR